MILIFGALLTYLLANYLYLKSIDDPPKRYFPYFGNPVHRYTFSVIRTGGRAALTNGAAVLMVFHYLLLISCLVSMIVAQLSGAFQ